MFPLKNLARKGLKNPVVSWPKQLIKATLCMRSHGDFHMR